MAANYSDNEQTESKWNINRLKLVCNHRQFQPISGTHEFFLDLRVGNWFAPSVSAYKGTEIHVV